MSRRSPEGEGGSSTVRVAVRVDRNGQQMGGEGRATANPLQRQVTRNQRLSACIPTNVGECWTKCKRLSVWTKSKRLSVGTKSKRLSVGTKSVKD